MFPPHGLARVLIVGHVCPRRTISPLDMCLSGQAVFRRFGPLPYFATRLIFAATYPSRVSHLGPCVVADRPLSAGIGYSRAAHGLLGQAFGEIRHVPYF